MVIVQPTIARYSGIATPVNWFSDELLNVRDILCLKSLSFLYNQQNLNDRFEVVDQVVPMQSIAVLPGIIQKNIICVTVNYVQQPNALHLDRNMIL